MPVTCKNCSNEFEGKFCNNCGQPASTHPMDFHSLWHDIQHGLFHFDSGILYTAKVLFTRPGKAIHEYIDGKRVRYFKPISFVVILATIYGLLFHTFHIEMDPIISTSGSSEIQKIAAGINEWLIAHYAWASLLLLPLNAFSSFIAFKKQRFNFVEHLVLNAYLTGQRLLLRIVTFPLVYAFNGTVTGKLIGAALGLVEFILVVWTQRQFFNKLSTLKSFFLTILSYLVFIITIVFVVGIVLQGFQYFLLKH